MAEGEGVLASSEPDKEEGSEETQPEGVAPADAPVRPEYIDEQFWDEEKGETKVEGLAKSYKDLRNEFNKRNDDKVGETVEDYATEEFYALDGMAAMKDDPIMQLALSQAQEAGMGIKQAQDFLSKFVAGMEEFKPEPVDVQAELDKLGNNGPHMVSGLKTWVDGMKAQGDINDEVHSEILKLGSTAAGIKALDVLRQKTGVMNIPTGRAVSGTTHMSADDWHSATFETHAEAGETKQSYDVRMHELGKTIFGTGHGTYNGAGLGLGNR